MGGHDETTIIITFLHGYLQKSLVLFLVIENLRFSVLKILESITKHTIAILSQDKFKDLVNFRQTLLR